MTKSDFLIISDISGCSKYVNESELEHAHDRLTDLLNVLIQLTQSPLERSKLESELFFICTCRQVFTGPKSAIPYDRIQICVLSQSTGIDGAQYHLPLQCLSKPAQSRLEVLRSFRFIHVPEFANFH